MKQYAETLRRKEEEIQERMSRIEAGNAKANEINRKTEIFQTKVQQSLEAIRSGGMHSGQIGGDKVNLNIQAQDINALRRAFREQHPDKAHLFPSDMDVALLR